jgi:FkbM family methyltransferase
MMQNVRVYLSTVGASGFLNGVVKRFTGGMELMSAAGHGMPHPVWVRVPSSDIWAFEQIFLRRDYAFETSKVPRVIIDAGANIGLAAVYLANRYPDCTIIAIEPEASNYELMVRNVAPYKNIRPMHAALWHRNEKIQLVDPHQGKWSFRTQSADSGDQDWGTLMGQVDAFTVDEIMRRHGVEHVDVLKVDIEGAEVEVFSDTRAWIDRVDALVVELHERKRVGCNRAFYTGSPGFDEEWKQGENIYLTRRGGCLRRAKAAS